MRAWQLSLWPLALFVLCGCGDRPVLQPNNNPNAAPPAPAREPAGEPFDQTKGFLHKPSGVGFVYPDGWERTETRSEPEITSFGLNKQNPKLTVTLYWTKSEEPLEGAAVGTIEYDTLAPLYGAKLGKPQPIQAGGRSGFKLPVESGPLGTSDAASVGAIYVFGVRKDGQWWKIKLRATVAGREHLGTVEQLLANYRW